MLQKKFQAPIVTAISPAETFYPTDADPLSYFSRNKENSYYVANIVPKLNKLKKEFSAQPKSEEAK